nr:dynein regulatory complex subunit 3-like [Lepeophtheirus salmonis]
MAISTNTRKEAIATHQGIILRTEGKEDKIATEKSKIDAEAEELKKDSKAFVSRFRNNGLKKSITEGENEEDIFGNLITNRNYISLKAKFESDEDDIGHRIYQYGHEQHRLRDAELRDLEVCLELGEKEYRDEGIIAVDEFLNERNRIQVEYLNFVNEATQGGGGSEEEERSLRKEFDRMKEICLGNLNIFKDKIMGLEFCLVNQTDKTIAFFEKTLLKSLDIFLNEICLLFSEARNADIRFYRRIVELIESETAVERCKFWREKAGQCHDIRQTRLSNIEVELEASVRHFYRLYVEDMYENLQTRNRSRILELQHFVDKCKAETEEYDFSSSNAVEEDDVY